MKMFEINFQDSKNKKRTAFIKASDKNGAIKDFYANVFGYKKNKILTIKEVPTKEK